MEIVSSKKTALLLGATGLVGRHLLEQLLRHGAYRRVIAPTRRKLHLDEPKLDNPTVDFEHLDRYEEIFRGHDLYIALGTTIAKAGSQENFRRVDFTYIVNAALLAKRGGANQCLLVSSAGADVTSRIFYSRVKGETELAVKQLDFWATHIFRPGVLLGEREEARLGEKVAATVTRALRQLSPRLLGAYNPTEAGQLARRMIEAAQTVDPGVRFYSARELL